MYTNDRAGMNALITQHIDEQVRGAIDDEGRFIPAFGTLIVGIDVIEPFYLIHSGVLIDLRQHIECTQLHGLVPVFGIQVLSQSPLIQVLTAPYRKLNGHIGNAASDVK